MPLPAPHYVFQNKNCEISVGKFNKVLHFFSKDDYFDALLWFFGFGFGVFLAALGLRCCARAFSSCGEGGLLFVEVRGLLIAVASLVVEHGL